jgi:hypothetical protein
MDRRQFLQSTTGAVLGAAVQPMSPVADAAVLTLDQVAARLAAGAKSPWLNAEATRIVWCLIRDLDVVTDPEAIVESVVEVNGNCIVITAGGSIAYYPSTVPLHEHSPSLKGRDFFGRVAAAARQKHLRLGARFDFIRQSRAALDAHPEWFFRRSDGSPATDATGCFLPCVNSRFYRTQAIEILTEVMDRYRPDLVFFNNFSNNSAGRSRPVKGADNSICHCTNCEDGYRTKYGVPLPPQPDERYAVFMQDRTDEASEAIGAVIRRSWPGTLFINANSDHSDGHQSEARPQGLSPVWGYATSEAVNRQRTSYPERVGINNCVGRPANTSRLILMQEEEMKVNLYQAAAHGSPLEYSFTGTPLSQDDRREVNALKRVFRWHASNADLYGLQVNLARVLLLCERETAPRRRNPRPEQSNRGVYRMLTEAHIPVAVAEDPRRLADAAERFDLVIVTEGASLEGVKDYVENGGRALFVNQAPPFGAPSPVRVVSETRTGYAEVRDSAAFPSLAGIRYVSCSGSYSNSGGAGTDSDQVATFLVYPDMKGAALTFVPPMIEEPVEFAHRDLRHTDIPALLAVNVGKGRVTVVPWDLGGAFTRGGLPIHANLFVDIVDSLLPAGRQIRTSAHPSIEMVLMEQPDRQRAVLHLINASGQSKNGYYPSIPMHAIDIEVKGDYTHAKARVAGTELRSAARAGRLSFALPVLREYEAVVLT